jgi:hypothetical protein
MKVSRSGPSLVRNLGYSVVGCGALSFVQYFYFKIKYSMPPDMGIVLGSAAVTMIGAVMLMVARCLIDLEQRVRRLENGHTAKNNGG